MAERRVRVTVQIRTEGKRCLDWNDDAACPYLCSEWATCQLFRADLEREEREYEAHGYLRAPACLALDAAELSPADAVARDLGAQHG